MVASYRFHLAGTLIADVFEVDAGDLELRFKGSRAARGGQSANVDARVSGPSQLTRATVDH